MHVAARKSVNLPAAAKENASKRPASRTVVSNPKKQRENSGTSSSASIAPAAPKRVTQSVATTARQTAVNFLNSNKWGKEVRPPHLEDDDVFNQIKENKVKHRGGREKPDEVIKKIMVEAGEDDAVTTLHKQRFSYRTPLQ